MNKRATEHTLNKEQFEQLQTLYIETIVDSMSMEDLQVYVTNDMADFCNELTEHDLIEEIKYHHNCYYFSFYFLLNCCYHFV